MSRDRFSTRRHRSVLAACTAAAALALGACGGDDEEATTEAAPSPEEEVQQVVDDFGQAEGADACDFVSESYLENLGGVEGCDREFADAVAVDYAISDVQVDGETATATAETDDQTVEFELVLEDGQWRISSAGPPDDGATTEADTSGDDEAAVEQVVADFGLAEGSTACDYVSQEYLQNVGGQAGCNQEFEEAVGVRYDISNVQVNGDRATAQAETDDQQIQFELVREDGVWKISSAGPG